MTTFDDLENALEANLKSRGVFDELKSRIRRETFACISAGQVKIQPQPPKEVLILNELVREYLEFTGYKQTSAVLNLETGTPKEQRLSREVLEAYLKVITPATENQPLLYSLIFGNQK